MTRNLGVFKQAKVTICSSVAKVWRPQSTRCLLGLCMSFELPTCVVFREKQRWSPVIFGDLQVPSRRPQRFRRPARWVARQSENKSWCLLPLVGFVLTVNLCNPMWEICFWASSTLVYFVFIMGNIHLLQAKGNCKPVCLLTGLENGAPCSKRSPLHPHGWLWTCDMPSGKTTLPASA